MFDIIQKLGSILNNLSDSLSGGDASLKGVISLMLIASLGTVVALGRNTPRKLIRLLKNRFTVEITFVDNWIGENRELFAAAGDFVSSNQIKRLFKIHSTRVSGGDLSIEMTVPESSGWFFYKGRPVYYSLSNAKEQGSVPEALTIVTIGRSTKTILDMIEASSKLVKNHTKRNFYQYDKEWSKVTGIPASDRRLWLRPDVKKALDAKIDFFKNNEDWYHTRSINHKLLIILHGPPGTGKSAIGRYIADRLGWSLGTLDSSSGFDDAIRAATSMEMVVSIPDVDAIDLAMTRGDVDGGKGKEKSENTNSNITTLMDPMLSAFSSSKTAIALNLFQGDLPLNNSVVVMSTNCLDKIDDALLRPSRCDLVLYIGSLGYDEVNGFRKHHYGIEDDLPDEFKSINIRACDLMEAFVDNAFDVSGFDSVIADKT